MMCVLAGWLVGWLLPVLRINIAVAVFVG